MVRAVVSTQDVSFGSAWTRLIGDRARWDSGTDELPPLQFTATPLLYGQGLVAVWVVGDGPVLVCDPQKGIRAIKKFAAGVTAEELRAALRAAGAVLHEAPAGARE
jgi:hypothetical protein